MSVKVYARYPPARPRLAVAVGAALLLGALFGAAWLSHLRSRPVTLGPAQPVPGLENVTIAWPSGWQRTDLSGGPGVIVAAASEKPSQGPAKRVLLLLVKRVGRRFVPPAAANLSLLAAVRGRLNPARLDSGGPATAGGLPAFDVQGPLVYKRQPYRMLFRALCDPSGRAIGLMLLSLTDSPAAAQNLLEAVAASLELSIEWREPSEALQELGLDSRPVTQDLRAFVHRLPVAEPVRVTFMAKAPSGQADEWAIDLWTSWKAKGQNLQDMAASFLRRERFAAKGSMQGKWVEHEGARIWKIPVERWRGASADLARWLYLRELPGRRVAWALGTWTSRNNAERIVLELLASVTPQAGRNGRYEQAVRRAQDLLSELSSGLLAQYYEANAGREQWFEYRPADGKISGFAARSVLIQGDRLSEAESLFLGETHRSRYEASGWTRDDLSAFEYTEQLRHPAGPNAPQRRLAYRKAGPDAPIAVTVRFGQEPPINGQFRTIEPFLPDPALKAAASAVARSRAMPVLFRCVGSAVEVPEAVELRGFGEQEVQVHGQPIRAFACEVRYNTSDTATLYLFDRDSKLIGSIWPSGASLMRTSAERIKDRFGNPRR